MDGLDYSLEPEQELKVVGPAICDWQNHPEAKLKFAGVSTCDWVHNPENANSDWGYEVERALAGKRTPFEPFTREELPRFHDEYPKILDRAKEVNSNAFRMSLDFAELCPKARRV